MGLSSPLAPSLLEDLHLPAHEVRSSSQKLLSALSEGFPELLMEDYTPVIQCLFQLVRSKPRNGFDSTSFGLA